LDIVAFGPSLKGFILFHFASISRTSQECRSLLEKVEFRGGINKDLQEISKETYWYRSITNDNDGLKGISLNCRPPNLIRNKKGLRTLYAGEVGKARCNWGPVRALDQRMLRCPEIGLAQAIKTHDGDCYRFEMSPPLNLYDFRRYRGWLLKI
jgi:hypothetical protein